MTTQPMDSAEPAPTSGRLALPGFVVSILYFLIAVGLPLVLILINARVLMGRPFLRMEYYRPNFPADIYGFTADERMEYGAAGLDYLFNGADVTFLGNLTFENGEALFNERELSHMTDVREVTAQITRFGVGLIVIYVLAVGLLAFGQNTRETLFAGLISGSVLTIVLIVVGIITTSVAFDWLFTQFHGLFFEGSTWLFPTSDTLIRLYPEQFWVDAFILMFGGAMLEALILGGMLWRRRRRKAAAA